jgi:hypothetical protein
MPKDISISKEMLNDLFTKVKSGEITLDQYHNLLLNNSIKQKKEKPIIKVEKGYIKEINDDAHHRKKQIKRWKLFV